MTSIATPRVRPPCRIINERRMNYRTMLFCACGWQTTVFHRNAMARVSRAKGEANRHLRERAEKEKEA